MDWKTLIAKLIEAGMTQRQIAAKAGCTAACISALARGERGARVSYEIGARLVELRDSLAVRSSD